jgi:MoaA/NifB/PqqE/SkfB family radical SAM enzyme/dephospho-CoA kinase
MNIVFGITGNLGTGKSTLANSLKSYWQNQGKSLQIIEIDDVRRLALWQSVQPHHIQLRKDLAEKFGLKTESENFWLDRKVFTDVIFSSQDALQDYSEIATPFLKYDVQSALSKAQTDVVIVWSLLLEENYSQLLNSSIIITDCSEQTVFSRLSPSIQSGNDLSYAELNQRIKLQPGVDSRILLAKKKELSFLVQNTENTIDEKILKELSDFLQKETNTFLSESKNKYATDLDFCKFKIPQNSGRVIWEVTNECNYGCKYCIFASTGRKPEGELTKEEIFSALLQLKEKGFSHIKFTGGEPFLREDMIEILKETNRLGFEFDISTNASKITEEIALELAKLNAEFIHVSLDGYDQGSHESVRGKKSFAPTLKGLKLLLSSGLKIRVGCVIHSENENNLADVVKFCSSIGVRHLVFSMMEPVGRLRDKTKGLATKSVSELANSLDSLKENYPYILISHNLQSMQKVSIDLLKRKSKELKATTPCPAGERFLFINSLGIVSPCTWVSEHRPQYVGGKINKNSLNEILGSKPIVEMREIADKLAKSGNSVCPMSDLNTTSEIELSLQAVDIGNHTNKFGKFAPIYRFTTENLSYLPILEIKGKKVLTVGGSYDHAIDLALLGAKTVENIDVNLCAKYYAQLKRKALLHLDFEVFKSFFGDSPKVFDFKIYSLLKPFLDFESNFFENFFEEIFNKFEHDGKKLFESSYFHNRSNQDFLNHSLYLRNEENYLKARENLRKQEFIWHSQSILESDDIGSFDIILLSNIADYSHKMFTGDNHAEIFKDKVVSPWLSHLEPNGKIMFAYVFDSQNILGSDKRNHFNNKDVRLSIYGNLEGYSFNEIAIESSIKGALTDNVCILERK